MGRKRKVGRPSSYKSYTEEYKRVKEAMKKRGYTMAEKRLTKMEWLRAHYAEKNDRLEAIKLGKRKTVGNINRDLVKRQQWTYSTAQARAQRKAYKLAGGTKQFKIADIKAEKVSPVDWNAISEREQELKGQGLSWNRVHTKISEEFFGS